MNSEEPLYTILDYILNKATSKELEVIAEAVQRRRRPGKGPGGLSPRGMAENMAESVKRQLGGMLDVHAISRQIVSDLVRQKEPNISEEELEVLLSHWLPGSARGKDQEQHKELPPDVLVTMVSQYLNAERGTLAPEEEKKLPENWKSQYWDTFPQRVRSLLRAHLGGEMDEVEFWNTLITSSDT